MDAETIRQLQIILSYIEEYENGNDDYYEAILEIIKALKHYKYTAKKSYIRTSFIILVSKLATTISNYNLLSDHYYQNLIGSCKEDLDYYMEASKVLDKYIKIGLKTGEFPDLDDAYMLSVKLSGILNCIMSYMHEIRMMEKTTNGCYTYIPRGNVLNEGNQCKQEVAALVKVLTGGEDV